MFLSLLFILFSILYSNSIQIIYKNHDVMGIRFSSELGTLSHPCTLFVFLSVLLSFSTNTHAFAVLHTLCFFHYFWMNSHVAFASTLLLLLFFFGALSLSNIDWSILKYNY